MFLIRICSENLALSQPFGVKKFLSGSDQFRSDSAQNTRLTAKTSIWLFKFYPKPTAIPRNYPPWASWSSKAVYLPVEFHSMEAFDSALSTVTDHFSEESLMESGKVDVSLLLLGLIYRKVNHSMEVEPGENTTAPFHWVDSLWESVSSMNWRSS